MFKLSSIHFISIIAILFFTGASFAEQSSKDSCIANFNIKDVDFNDPIAKMYLSYLTNYFLCRAASSDNIDECPGKGPASDVCGDVCRDYFRKYQSLYGRLMLRGSVTTDILASCINKKGKGPDENDCRIYANAILKSDPSLCLQLTDKDRINKCRETAEGQIKTDNAVVIYMKAVKTKDKKMCNSLPDMNAKTMCTGIIDRDVKKCEDDDDFKNFRNNYCESKANN